MNPNTTGTTVSARWRIVGWIVVTTALALLAVTATMRSLLMGQVTGNADAEIVQETDEFRAFAATGVSPVDKQPFSSMADLIQQYLSLQTPSTGEAIIGVAGDQVLFTDNTSANAGELLANDRGRLNQIVNNAEASGAVQTDHGELRWGKVTVTPMQSGDATGVLIVAHFTSLAKERVEHEAVLLFGVALGGLFLTAGIAWLAAGRILLPLRHINAAAAEITAQDLSARLPVPGRDDISDLAVTLNQMLDRVERAYASQRHFVSEAQRHLNAPLVAATRRLNDVAAITGDPHCQDAARDVRGYLEQMQDRLADLDILALSDAPGFVTPSWVSVKEITADIFTEALTAHPHRRVEVEATASGHGWLDADRVLDAMRQLLDNAASHSEPNTPIHLGSAVSNDRVRFWVANEGPQLEAEQARDLFEVYRTEEDADAGMGLGLAVVKAVADAHQGSAWVESEPGLTRFGMELPLTALEPAHPADEED